MLEAKVRALVALYLAEQITVDELERGLPDGWDLDGGDPRERRTVLRVMGYLAEFRRNRYRERGLKTRLASLGAWTSPPKRVGTRSGPVTVSGSVWRASAKTAQSFGGRR